MTLKEQVVHGLESLSETDLEQVVEYVSFLKFRARLAPMPPLDETQLAALCEEFGGEDRRLAEEGMSDYAEGLKKEEVS